MHGKALWYVAPGRAELREEPISARPGEVPARALRRGQPRHRRLGSCRAGAGERIRSHARTHDGRSVSVPGQVRLRHGRAGRGRPRLKLRGRTVFSLHPHQSMFNVPADAVTVVPDNVPPARAVMAPIWRRRSTRSGTAPGPADRIAVVGGACWDCWSPISARGFPAPKSRWSTLHRRRARARAMRSGGICGPERSARRRIARQRSACRLRPGLSCQRQPGGPCHRAAAGRRGGERRRAQLVRLRRRRGAARRSVPQPPPAADFEPGRQSRAVPSPALEPRATPRGRACAACGSGARRSCSRRPSRLRICRQACLRYSRTDSNLVCQLIRYGDETS